MSERYEPVDPRHEDALTQALHAQADTVRPAGDGLIRIRERVEKRRARNRWIIPTATCATVAATVTAVVASGVLSGSGHHDNTATVGLATLSATSSHHPTPSATPPSAAPTPSPFVVAPPSTVATRATTPPAVTTAPTTPTMSANTMVPSNAALGATPVWPFSSTAEAVAWQKTAATNPDQWRLDPRGVAERFVGSLKLPKMQFSGTSHVARDNGTATVDVNRIEPTTGRTTRLGTVLLSRWSHGVDAPWGVVGVTSSPGAALPLAITSPKSGATVGSPLPVSFTLTGAEDDVFVSAWAAGATSPSATKHIVTAIGATVTLTSLPTSGRGYVVVADGNSGGDSLQISRLAVVPVAFGAPTTTAATYVAVHDGTLNVYDAATDTEVHPLAGDSSGATQVAVSDDRQWVYYLKTGPNCSGVIMRTPADGSGSPQVVSTAASNISAFSISGPHAEHLSYVSTTCSGAQTLTWPGGKITTPAIPPDARTVAISPDGTSVAAFVRTGTQGNVFVFKQGGPHSSYQDGTVPAGCAGTDGTECVGATYAANGDLVTVTSDGQTLKVQRQHGAGAPTTLFSVTDSSQLATVDLDPTGTKVLLTDGAGKGWSWSGTGAAKPLPVSMTGASW